MSKFKFFAGAGLAAAGLSIAISGIAHAAAAPPTTVQGNGWMCTRTQPEYMIHAGGSTLRVQNGTDKFTILAADSPGYSGMSAPYVTAGYNSSLSAGLCNSRGYHNSYKSRAYSLPVKLGKQGHVVASVHDITSGNFLGDSGFDIWFTASPASTTYDQMVNGGASTTEIMIWLSHPGLGRQTESAKYYPVIIGGRRWYVQTGLAANGHGKKPGRAGWNVVNFIAPDIHNGNISANNLLLNSFFSYAISHGWLNQHDYLTSLNQGFELTQGTASVAGYVLSGLPH